MRIRQVRPEFFTDPVMARLTPEVRLTYIGLWCVADDAGWLVWDVDQIGALLYPYESIRVRTRRVERAAEALCGADRIVIHPCKCALIPKLEDHQRIGGNKSFPVRDRHRVHTSTDLSARNVTVGNGMERNGIAPQRSPDGAGATDQERDALLEAFARQGLPVGRKVPA